ncbi:hypothetical protein XH96_08655 [Bradyrhizobium sp. CCBAU 51765]|nr:hypothetical protein XH96_08655 [Bradyrhizobium sp. CCBAU 51765]
MADNRRTAARHARSKVGRIGGQESFNLVTGGSWAAGDTPHNSAQRSWKPSGSRQRAARLDGDDA